MKRLSFLTILNKKKGNTDWDVVKIRVVNEFEKIRSLRMKKRERNEMVEKLLKDFNLFYEV